MKKRFRSKCVANNDESMEAEGVGEGGIYRGNNDSKLEVGF